jgi:hypothetical protein
MNDGTNIPGGLWLFNANRSQQNARRGLRPQMEDQSAAYDTEGDPRRDEGNHYSLARTMFDRGLAMHPVRTDTCVDSVRDNTSLRSMRIVS